MLASQPLESMLLSLKPSALRLRWTIAHWFRRAALVLRYHTVMWPSLKWPRAICLAFAYFEVFAYGCSFLAVTAPGIPGGSRCVQASPGSTPACWTYCFRLTAQLTALRRAALPLKIEWATFRARYPVPTIGLDQ